VSDVVEVGFADAVDENRLVVEWLLSSVCNYRCSYCPPELHDGRLRFPEWEAIEDFSRRLIHAYRGRDVTLLLTGGEPTVYRRLLDLADLVHELGGAVAVLSNGSRALGWWEHAAGHLDEVILSYHAESADAARFVELASFLAPRVRLQVNVVMAPRHFDACLAVARELERAAPDAVIHSKPLMDRWRALHDYSREAQEHMAQPSSVEPSNRRYPRGTVLKGDLVRRRRDGTSETVTPIQLLLEGGQRWKGWDCSIGLQTLFIRRHAVYRSVCGVGGCLGSIYNTELEFPSAGVTCARETCNCIAGIKVRKRAPRVGAIAGEC
jgi:organic radical activating enzyme